MEEGGGEENPPTHTHTHTHTKNKKIIINLLLIAECRKKEWVCKRGRVSFVSDVHQY